MCCDVYSPCTTLTARHDKLVGLDQQGLSTFCPPKKLEGGLDLACRNSDLGVKDWNLSWAQEELRSTSSWQYPDSLEEQEDNDVKNQITWSSSRGFQEEADEKEDDLYKSGIIYDDLHDIFHEDTLLVVALKTCSKDNDLGKGCRLHANIVQKGLLETNVFVSNSLVHLYAKSGNLSRAQALFEEVGNKNVVSWNGLIAGYVQHGHGDMAFECFHQMQINGIAPNRATFLSLLKACVSQRAAMKGQELHALMVKVGSFDENVPIANAVIDMYAKCAMLERAEDIFDKLIVRDVVTWNSIINAYAQDDLGEEALFSFRVMQEQAVLPDEITYVSVLKACSISGTVSTGQEIHTHVLARDSLKRNAAVATAVIDMYAKCGLFDRAWEAFNKLSTRTLVTWNALIAGCVQHEHFEDAFTFYAQMRQNNVVPDEVTFICMSKACCALQAWERCLALHDEIAEVGLSNSTVTANAFIDMYGKCGLIKKAEEVFDNLAPRNIFSWNAMIANFARGSQENKALAFFSSMQLEGFLPDALTFISILKVHGSMKDAEKGLQTHATVTKLGWAEEEPLVSNGLVTLYSDLGMLAEAQEVFDSLSNRNVASWNSLIAGFSENEYVEEALQSLEYMVVDGFSPNAVTFFSILKACGSMGTAQRGQAMHNTVVKFGLIERDIVLETALVDMYAKCGMLEESQGIFFKSLNQDVVMWNVLVAGHAELGQADVAFEVLRSMMREEKSPDILTFTSLLNMCNHTGLVEKGQLLFKSMIANNGISINLELCNCLVGLFTRAGRLDETIAMIEEMPFFADLSMWHILLCASQSCGSVKAGIVAFSQAALLNDADAASYTSLSNVFAAVYME